MSDDTTVPPIVTTPQTTTSGSDTGSTTTQEVVFTPPTTTEPVPTTTAPPIPPKSCSTPDYAVEYPGDWFTSDTFKPCALFSPAPLTVPGEAEFQFEITFYISPLTYLAAIDAFEDSTGQIITGFQATTVDGQSARYYDSLTTSDAPVGGKAQYTYLVDLGDRTLYAWASEYLDGSAAAPDFPASQNALDSMMDSIGVAVGVPPVTTTIAGATCPGDPAISGPIVATATGWDLDGDTIDDNVSIHDNPSTGGGWVRAALSGGGFLDFALTSLDTSGEHGPVELTLVDLDPQTGVGLPEVLYVANYADPGPIHEILTVDGCQLRRPNPDASEGSPLLSKQFTPAFVGDWGCATQPDGGTTFTVSWRDYLSDTSTPAYWRQDTWGYASGAWTLLEHIDTDDSPLGEGIVPDLVSECALL